MSISALFGTSLTLFKPAQTLPSPSSSTPEKWGAPLIECSSCPQKKGTKHHMKTRPKKSQPWDIKHRPTVYACCLFSHPDWTLIEVAFESVVATEEEATAAVAVLSSED